METDQKSPFTGGPVTLEKRTDTINFRGEKFDIEVEFYRCSDTGMQYTDSKLDDNAIWRIVRAYCERHDISPFDLLPKKESKTSNEEEK